MNEKIDYPEVVEELINKSPINNRPDFNPGDKAEWYTYKAEWGAKPSDFKFQRIGNAVEIESKNNGMCTVRALAPPSEPYEIEEEYLFPI